MCRKINEFWIRFITWIAIIVFTMLAVMNVLITGYFKTTYAEWTYFRIDYFWLGLPLIALFIWGASAVQRKVGFEKLSGTAIVTFLFTYAFLWGIGWIAMSKSTPIADRWYVSAIAESFIEGDYSWYDTGKYLFWYPYQTGIAACIELIYRLFGAGNYNVVKVVNAVAVAASFVAVYSCTGIIFEEESGATKRTKRIQNIAAVLSFGCIAAMFFVTYVYGNLIGMALALWAVYFELRFLKEHRAVYILPATVLVTLAYIVKSNYAIVIVGMVMFLLLDALRNKKAVTVLLAAAMVVCSVGGSKGLMAYYSHRADRQFNDGVPKIMWVQMGLKEGWFGYGTYDRSTIDIYKKYNYDGALASEEAKEIIGQRLKEFVQDPVYGAGFFFEKTALQWCEPTYQSIWESNCADNHYGEISDFTQNIYTGWLHEVLVIFMDIYQSLIWLCAAAWVILNKNKMNEKKLLLITIILGGFAFHTFWESKSQYVLQYFVMLIPYGAAGLSNIIEIINKCLDRQSANRRLIRRQDDEMEDI